MIPKKFIEIAVAGLDVKQSVLQFFSSQYPETYNCESLETQIPKIKKDLDLAKVRKSFNFNEGSGGAVYRNEYITLASTKLSEKKSSVSNFSCTRTAEEAMSQPTANSNQTLPNTVNPVTVSGVTASNPIANQNSSAGPQSAVSTASQTATNANQTASVSEKAKSFPVFFQDKNKLVLAGGGLLIAIVGGYYFIKKRKSQV